MIAHSRSATWLAAVLLGCRPAAPAPHPLTMVDDAGDTVHLAAPARRIVSLNPVITELVFALGAGGRLVGRTSECDFPPAAKQVPSVGGWLPPNVEAVVARAPDLVLLYHSASTAPAAARLRALHIPSLAFRTDRLRDVSRVARALGPVVGAERAAERLAAGYDDSLGALGRSTASDPSHTVALVAWNSPLIVLGAGSFLSEMVELAGARNVFGDIALPSAPTSLEAVAARAPRALLVAGAGELTRPEWRAVSAVRERRVVLLTDPALERPSPRAPAAIAALRRRLDSILGPTPHQETSR